MRLRGAAAPTALALAVVALVATAVWLARAARHDGEAASRPPLLHLTSSGAVAAAPGTGTGAPYELVGELPTGRPADQQVRRPAAATAADAGAVARALGIPGTPTAVRGGWVIRDGDNRLAVRAEGGWYYGLDCSPDRPVTEENLDVACAVASAAAVVPADGSAPDASAEPAPDAAAESGPTAAEARAVAGPILDRLGLAGADIDVSEGSPTTSVTAGPRAGDLDTSGWDTSLQIDADGRVTTGNGWLPTSTAGTAYPVVDAAQAFALLLARPRPLMELCMQRPDGEPGCAERPPAQVTGAHLGLVLDTDGSGPLLVPAWLFDLHGRAEPAAQVAVDPAYLATPVPPEVGPPADEPSAVPPQRGSSGPDSG